MEMENLQKGQDSDSDLEPPFEIHGIEEPEPHNEIHGKLYQYEQEPQQFIPILPIGMDEGPLQPLAQYNEQELIELYPIEQAAHHRDSLTENTQAEVAIEDYPSDSSGNEVPDSIQFEQRPLFESPPRRQYDLSQDLQRPPPRPRKHRRRSSSGAIHNWEDVSNMDSFLIRLYEYYAGKGIYCIILESITSLLTVLFVVGLTVFLTECVDYNSINHSKKLIDVLIPRCYAKMKPLTFLTVLFCSAWFIYQILRMGRDIPTLLETKSFYDNTLNISDSDLQSNLWSDVVSRIIQTNAESTRALPGKRLDAHIIANRIMRKENYLIAMFNKDILDLRVPFLGNRHWMTRLIHDYIAYGIFSYVFDEKGKFRKRFLKINNKPALVEGLQKRFQTMAVLTLLFSPFLFLFMIITSVFKLSEEYRQNPALLGARSYTPLARWNLREFNELKHLFNKRLTSSHFAATKYIQQFPNYHIMILARFISFVTGSFASVLLIITLFEEELQHGFEITPSKSAFFYIGLFGSIMAVTQGMTQDNIVHEPQRWMNELVLDTHYHPKEWRENAHLTKVRDQFSIMFEYKIVILIQELLSVLFSPLILYYSLPQSASQIVDFFRTFTIHVDSIGYVCNFAVFDLDRQGTRQANNPEWNPGVQGSQYLSRVFKRALNPRQNSVAFSRMNPMTYSRMNQMGYSESPGNYPGESVMNQSMEDNQAVGRDFVRLLDAFYDGNKRA